MIPSRRRVLGTWAALALTAGFPPAQAAARAPLPRAPALALPDLAGHVHRIDDYAGRGLVLNFWATWCAPCRAEIPSLNRASRALAGNDVAFLALDVGEAREAVEAFTKDTPVAFPVLLDREQAATRRWPVMGLPTTFIVDPGGRIALRVMGPRKWHTLAMLARIRALVSPGGSNARR